MHSQRHHAAALAPNSIGPYLRSVIRFPAFACRIVPADVLLLPRLLALAAGAVRLRHAGLCPRLRRNSFRGLPSIQQGVVTRRAASPHESEAGSRPDAKMCGAGLLLDWGFGSSDRTRFSGGKEAGVNPLAARRKDRTDQ